MKKHLNRLIWITCTFLMISSAFVSAYAANVTIGVPERAQEHSQWCWAGSSKAVLDYYGTSVSQCTIANWAWSRSDCCGNTDFNWSHTCNQANAMYGTSGSLQAIMSHWGVASTASSSYLSWATVVSEINAQRPFVMRFGWTGGGGHFLDGYGYDNASPGYVHYMDPWPGNGYTKALYSTTVSSSDHTWTHTLKVTTNHYSAQVTSLYPVSNANPGSTSTLYANIKNTSASALPSNAVVWYYVSGPGFTGYVGSSSVAGLAAGSSAWNSRSWAIPSSLTPGIYSYWAIVYLGNTTAISAWSSAQRFSIGYHSQVTSLWQVYNASAGSTSTYLHAYVKNTGNKTLPSNARVYFYVSGPGMTGWLGSYASASGLTPGSSAWKSISWNIPSSMTPGYYYYQAIVYLSNTDAISSWSSSQAFPITSATNSGFTENFSGSSANWFKDSGSWSISSSIYYYTAGRAGYFNESTYNRNYSNLDYSAQMWRSGHLANFLIVRGWGSALSDGDLYSLYRFQYMDDGTFSVWKRVGGTYTALKAWTASSAINKGAAWNILRVRAVGSTFYFYINGTQVWSGTDSSLTNGRVGVGMYRGSTSTGDGFWVNYATLTVPTSAATGGGDAVDMDIDESSAPSEGEVFLNRDVNGVDF